jgi:hypothetical protein
MVGVFFSNIAAEFQSQTCFRGVFGPEQASDEYGAHIIMHAAEPDTQKVVGRLSYIEVSRQNKPVVVD